MLADFTVDRTSQLGGWPGLERLREDPELSLLRLSSLSGTRTSFGTAVITRGYQMNRSVAAAHGDNCPVDRFSQPK